MALPVLLSLVRVLVVLPSGAVPAVSVSAVTGGVRRDALPSGRSGLALFPARHPGGHAMTLGIRKAPQPKAGRPYEKL